MSLLCVDRGLLFTCVRVITNNPFIVDVSSHKIGKKESFGKAASDIWQRCMQMAEGPNAFRAGYEKLMVKYSKDARRRRYIEELFRSPDKHHFSRRIRS